MSFQSKISSCFKPAQNRKRKEVDQDNSDEIGQVPELSALSVPELNFGKSSDENPLHSEALVNDTASSLLERTPEICAATSSQESSAEWDFGMNGKRGEPSNPIA